VASFKAQVANALYQIPLTVNNIEEAEEALELATQATVNIARKVNLQFNCRQPRSEHKDGFSAEFLLRKIHLTILNDIYRRLTSKFQAARYFSLSHMQHAIKSQFHEMYERGEGLNMDTAAVDKVVQSTGCTLQFLFERPTGPTPKMLESAIKLCKKQLHGRRRQELRKRAAGFINSVEQSREAGRLKTAIKAVLQEHAGRKHNDRVLLDSVTTPAGKVINSPAELHTETTRHAKEFYAIPPEFDNELHRADNWEPYINNIDMFLAVYKDSKIPQWCLHLIHKALQVKPGADRVHEELTRTLADPPTLAEFKHGISKAKTNSAPGMSGLTNNMVKSWPEAMVQYIYNLLCWFWKKDHVQAAWKWRWLQYIPKKISDEIKLLDLRPLMLLEVLRKIWTADIGSKVDTAISRHNLLEPIHQGYRPGHGTTTASIIHINYAEDVEEKTSVSHQTSYDQSKAFDCPSKPAINWIWRRSGVPVEWAYYLARLDVGGTTVVKTPLAENLWHLHPYHCVMSHYYPPGLAALDPDSFQIESFDAERGTGQGDPNSGRTYLMVEDVAATALRLLDEEFAPTFVTTEDNVVYPHEDIGYADDKKSGSYSAAHIQRKAELMSALNIVLGLQFSTTKIRRLLQNFLPDPSKHAVEAMVIYTVGWVPQPIPIQHDGSSEYLGTIQDLDNSTTSVMTWAKTTVQSLTQAIQAGRFSMTTKLAVTKHSALKKVQYKLALSNISHKELTELECILD